MLRFAVYGEPVGKARPRFNTKTRTAYTPSKTAEYEREIAAAYRAVGKGKMFNGAVALDISAYFAIPKSTPKKKLFQFLQNIFRPTKKPDIDNIMKIIMDGLNGIAYEDDKQVVSGRIRKFYSTEPRVEVGGKVMELEYTQVACVFKENGKYTKRKCRKRKRH